LASGSTARWDFRPFFEAGVVDIIQPDLSHAGGILEVRKIAAMAEAYDVAVTPHCPLGPLALGACLQIAACTPNHAIQEISLGSTTTPAARPFELCTNKEALTPVGATFRCPRDPAWGSTSTKRRCVRRTRTATAGATRSSVPDDGSFAEW
jgi:galactonate dehydratase